MNKLTSLFSSPINAATSVVDGRIVHTNRSNCAPVAMNSGSARVSSVASAHVSFPTTALSSNISETSCTSVVAKNVASVSSTACVFAKPWLSRALSLLPHSAIDERHRPSPRPPGSISSNDPLRVTPSTCTDACPERWAMIVRCFNSLHRLYFTPYTIVKIVLTMHAGQHARRRSARARNIPPNQRSAATTGFTTSVAAAGTNAVGASLGAAVGAVEGAELGAEDRLPIRADETSAVPIAPR